MGSAVAHAAWLAERRWVDEQWRWCYTLDVAEVIPRRCLVHSFKVQSVRACTDGFLVVAGGAERVWLMKPEAEGLRLTDVYDPQAAALQPTLFP